MATRFISISVIGFFALTALALACGAARQQAPGQPAGSYASPRLSVDIPPNAEYLAEDEAGLERSASVAVEVVIREQRGTNVLGIVEGALYLVRDRALFRRPLQGGPETQLHHDVESDLAIAVDGDEVFYATRDCEVSSTKQHRLGGECSARVRDLFVDAEFIYIMADERVAWRNTETGLWRMPRAGGPAAKVATLPSFGRIIGPERVLFDGQSFYYMNTFGTILRVSKRGGQPVSFLPLDIQKARQLEFVGRDAIFVTSGDELLRAPFDGKAPLPVANVAGGEFAANAQTLYLATASSLFAAPLGGGAWQRVAGLPNGDWQPTVVAGKIYLRGYDVVLAVDPAAERARKVLELDDVLIGSLSVDRRGVFFTTSEAEHKTGFWLLDPHGNEPQKVFDEARLAAAPAFDDKFVYFVREDGALLRRALDADTSEVLVSASTLAKLAGAPLPAANEREALGWPNQSAGELPRDVLFDETHVYWLDRSLSLVARVAKDQKQPELVTRFRGRGLEFGLDAQFAYVRRQTAEAEGILRLQKAPGSEALVLVDSRDGPPSLALTSAGPVWTSSERTVEFSHLYGFRSFLPLTSSNRLASLVGFRNTLFFAYSPGENWVGTIGSRAVESELERILSIGHDFPTSLTPTADAVYFVESGFDASPKSTLNRVGCCAIWRAPR